MSHGEKKLWNVLKNWRHFLLYYTIYGLFHASRFLINQIKRFVTQRLIVNYNYSFLHPIYRYIYTCMMFFLRSKMQIECVGFLSTSVLFECLSNESHLYKLQWTKEKNMYAYFFWRVVLPLSLFLFGFFSFSFSREKIPNMYLYICIYTIINSRVYLPVGINVTRFLC
jgi:hypothetical protein